VGAKNTAFKEKRVCLRSAVMKTFRTFSLTLCFFTESARATGEESKDKKATPVWPRRASEAPSSFDESPEPLTFVVGFAHAADPKGPRRNNFHAVSAAKAKAWRRAAGGKGRGKEKEALLRQSHELEPRSLSVSPLPVYEVRSLLDLARTLFRVVAVALRSTGRPDIVRRRPTKLPTPSVGRRPLRAAVFKGADEEGQTLSEGAGGRDPSQLFTLGGEGDFVSASVLARRPLGDD